MSSIKKSEGTTPSEKLLSELCEKTFLNLWSYANVYRDQGQKKPKSQGKEICDLLVIFGHDIIIFSDKSCSMQYSDDIDLDWRRWFTKAIDKSAKQIYGAERWIKNFPDRIFLDRNCQHRMPLKLDPLKAYRIHRIVIATGARNRCKNLNNGSGSLQICPEIVGKDHVDTSSVKYQPFSIGQLDPFKGYVHVLDDYTVKTLLEELDTVSDFVRYLKKKEDHILLGTLDFAAGEEEVLCWYLKNSNRNNKIVTAVKAGEKINIQSGCWQAWRGHDLYVKKKVLDEPSHQVWDELINLFSYHAVSNKLLPGSSQEISEIELCLRVMASESRLARRALSAHLIERMAQTINNTRAWRMLFSSEVPDTGYIFFFYRRDENYNFEEYRNDRIIYLKALSIVYALNNHHLKQVIGIATETGLDSTQRSWEIELFIPGKWSEDLQRVKELQKLINVKDSDFNSHISVTFDWLPK